MAAPSTVASNLSIARPSEPPTLACTTRIAVITDQYPCGSAKYVATR